MNYLPKQTTNDICDEYPKSDTQRGNLSQILVNHIDSLVRFITSSQIPSSTCTGGSMKASKPKLKRDQKHNTIYFLRKIGDGLARQHDELPNYNRKRQKETH